MNTHPAIPFADEARTDDEDNTQEDEDSSQSNKVGQENGNEEEEEEDDEDEVDETTNVRKKHERFGSGGEHSARDIIRNSKAKIRARRKKRYNIQFTFDADVRCSVTIFYFCTEDVTNQVSVLLPVVSCMGLLLLKV